MADQAEVGQKTGEEVTEGDEPGASRSSMLISDSYEDLTNILQEHCTTGVRTRLKSGTINEITGAETEGEDSASVSSSRNDDGSSSDSHRNTPVKHVEVRSGHILFYH